MARWTAPGFISFCFFCCAAGTALRYPQPRRRERNSTVSLDGFLVHDLLIVLTLIALRLDIDLIAGETGGQASVLALLADGQRQLIVRHDDAAGLALFRHHDVHHVGGRQSSGDELGGVLAPLDNVDLLTAEFIHDGGDTLALDSRDCYVRAEHRLVACVGLHDIVVVETPDAVLVAHKQHLQSVKDVVATLKTGGRLESALHRKIFRPWGYYDSVDEGERFQVKRIVVNPGASLSLQMHHHRAEHWVVVSGTARVRMGDKEMLLSENQSTYIPLGVVHRLENPGRIPLEMIEVQSGAYLGEDDIVRFEDCYGRG